MVLCDFITEKEDEVLIDAFGSTKSVEPLLIKHSYLVAFRDSEFYGILTLKDYVENHHKLIIDCITEKPVINLDDSLENAVALMLGSNTRVLPVLGKDGYRGSVSMHTVLTNLMSRFSVQTDRKTDSYTEPLPSGNRLAFLKELFHNTRNPVQNIISAVDMMQQEDLSGKQKQLAASITENAMFIADILASLTRIYL